MYQKSHRGGGNQSIHSVSALYSTSHYSDVEGFKQFAQGYGLPIPEISADGKIHRFQVEGDKRGTRNGWYVYFSYPVAAGAVGSWKTGESFTWCAKSTKHLTYAEREALRRQYQQARDQRAREHEQEQQAAAIKARAILQKATPAQADHAYLLRKRMPADGLKVYKDSILAELRDIHGTLHSLQFIKPDGGKFFLSNGRIKGVFHTFGSLEDSPVIYLAEGLATAATVHHWKQAPVLAAMNAGNLLPVALAVRQEYPTVQLVIAADNDRHNPAGNVGKLKAEEAARIVGGSVLLPEFPKGSTGTDWNDWFIESGGVLP
ncbi:MAG: toprim domain-containing protein [Thiolinea sp.]